MKNRFRVDGGVTTIFIVRRNGAKYETIIDTADFLIVREHTWGMCIDKDGYWPYAVTKVKSPNGNKTTVRMHRLLVGEDNIPEGMEVDHFNRKTLDNRRAVNLRVVTPCVNLLNTGASRNSKTGIRGVTWAKHVKRWLARIKILKQVIHVGYFDTIQEASAALVQFHQKHLELASLTPGEVRAIIEARKPLTHEDRVAQSQKAARVNWERRGKQILTHDDHAAIKRRRDDGESFRSIGRALNISGAHAGNVYHGKVAAK